MRLPVPLKTVLFTFALIFLFSGSAAAEINDAGRKRLQTLFTELLASYTESAAANGVTVEAEGKLLVEPGDFYYAVTLPHLTVRMDDGSYTEIGMPAFNIMPGDSPELWKMTLAVPTPIVHYAPNGMPVVMTNFGSQNFAGIWHEKFRNFIKINARYRDIETIHNKDRTRVLIQGTHITSDMTQDENGFWSGPTDIIATGIQAGSKNGDTTLYIGEIKGSISVSAYSPEAALAYEEQIRALAESHDAGDRPSDSAIHVLGLYNMLANFLAEGQDGFAFDIALKDFTMTKPPLPVPGSQPGSLKIGSAGFGFSMNGLRKGLVETALDLHYNGFDLKPENKDGMQELVPTDVRLDLQINNLPYKDIIDLGRGTIQASMQDAPEAAKFAGLQAIMVLPQLLTQAQTNLEIKDTKFANTHYELKTDGVMTADLKAVAGATGTMYTEIQGIDKLTAMLEKASKNEGMDTEQAKKIRETLAMMAVIQMAGQIKKNAAGQDVRTYNLELNPQGQMLLNGTDIKMLMPAGE